jgi:hypothetical protein
LTPTSKDPTTITGIAICKFWSIQLEMAAPASPDWQVWL